MAKSRWFSLFWFWLAERIDGESFLDQLQSKVGKTKAIPENFRHSIENCFIQTTANLKILPLWEN